MIASWRHGNPRSIQDRESLDKDSHVLVLGREDLTRLYTSTLVSRMHFIYGQSIVRVEDRFGECAGHAAPSPDFSTPRDALSQSGLRAGDKAKAHEHM